MGEVQIVEKKSLQKKFLKIILIYQIQLLKNKFSNINNIIIEGII